jgi:hypothetical protein
MPGLNVRADPTSRTPEENMKVKISRVLVAAALAVAALTPALADTIRLKNGSVIRGTVIGFREEQFVIVMEPTARGRRNQITVYAEEVESIEFDGAGGATSSAPAADTRQPEPRAADTRTYEPPSSSRTGTQSEPRLQGATSAPASQPRAGANTSSTASQPQPSPSSGSPSQFVPIRVRVRADSASNGWTDSGLMVRKGQRLRISASGRVSLGQGRFTTPTGLPRILDNEKLMRDEPTGALIAVIGDDNDDFIFVGAGREFYAPRDGRLFLGVNEGNLADNTGNFEALVEAEPVATSSQARP